MEMGTQMEMRTLGIPMGMGKQRGPGWQMELVMRMEVVREMVLHLQTEMATGALNV